MNNTAIVKILKTFSKQEMKDFEKFVDSPYFNTSEATAKLFKELKPSYPKFERKELTKENLFHKIYGKQKYNEVLMRKLVSNLLKLSEEFIVNEEGKERKEEFNHRILTQYLKRNLNENFENRFSKALDYLVNRPKTDSDFYQIRNLYGLSAHNHGQKSEYRKAYSDYRTCSEYMLLDYQISISNMIVILNDFRFELKIEDENIFNEIIFEFIERPELAEFIGKHLPRFAGIHELYLMQMKVSKFPTEEIFRNFKDLTFKNIQGLDKQRKRSFMISLNNHFNRTKGKINKSDNLYLEILDFELKEDLLSYYGSAVHIGDFTNKLYILLEAGEISRAEDFNKTYSDKLDKELRKSGYNYGMAYISFHKKDFESSINYLAQTKHRVFPLNYYVRRLTVQNYIELRDTESALSAIESFRHFLSENSDVSTNAKNAFDSFLKYCKSISMYFSNGNKSALNDMFFEFKKDRGTQMKFWLNQKFEEYLS